MGTYLSTPRTDKETGVRQISASTWLITIVATNSLHWVDCFRSSMECGWSRTDANVGLTLAEFGYGQNLSYGMCGMQGWRRTMEDAHICAARLLDRDDMSLFGVFDGHGGAEVAQFCAKYFVRELVASDSFLSGDFDNALKQGFHKMDSLLSDESYAQEIATVSAASPTAFLQILCIIGSM
jgi:hypothetical protein